MDGVHPTASGTDNDVPLAYTVSLTIHDYLNRWTRAQALFNEDLEQRGAGLPFGQEHP
ncbi:hypothetical protein ONA91_38685 [Micromonospora sp. DR5-3]|uniref:hypothetical protein n=1 Tax=unclassified Micromonospora TaxID=2617518 RepID=UPI001651FDB0|nr:MULTISPECIES: hypothetical protein [unclassified Micromonospora]MCW3820375.1 hypothetical protein [Micromonospora sp. DR5-3]